MSVKKHYQKRNQELNKDLMKRWGYALPEEPIDEGLFDRLKSNARSDYESVESKFNKLRDITTGTTKEKAAATSGGPSSKENAKAIADSLGIQSQAIARYYDEILLSLNAAGIGKETAVYRKLETRLEDSLDAMDITDTEISQAMKKTSAEPKSSGASDWQQKEKIAQEKIATAQRDVEEFKDYISNADDEAKKKSSNPVYYGKYDGRDGDVADLEDAKKRLEAAKKEYWDSRKNDSGAFNPDEWDKITETKKQTPTQHKEK